MKKLFTAILLITVIMFTSAYGQEPSHYNWGQFTRVDSLRGYLSTLRSCYDVLFYNLDIKVDTSEKSIKGSNTIKFSVVTPFDRMQVDLFANMNVDKIEFEDGTPLKYSREAGAVFINMPALLKQNSVHQIIFYYSGKPQVAERPPWDGGFVWTKDKKGNPWIEVTCQGTGASLWWPNKDHQSDEPDSMMINITVPKGLEDISNGRLRSKTELPDGSTKYSWFVSYPINNYDVTINICSYAHFSDEYTSTDGSKLTLDYYVLPENLEKAQKHFKEVKTMIACFEKDFGKYPFYRDGYKLIESSHNGMEHQSAVAYGNHYMTGYEGYSSSNVGLNFDFIIIHESAHEWWGNSITSNDIADMWIHESFGAYAEGLYVEYNWGHDEALKYMNGKKQNIRNDKPIIGPYNVNEEGAGDMYDKGQLVLNTLRDVINNDTLWFSILRGLQEQFGYKSINGDDVFNYINKRTGQDYNYFFEQYFRYTNFPVFTAYIEKKGNETALKYRWEADVKDFRMPLKVTTSKGRFEFIYPTTKFQTMKLTDFDPADFKVDEDGFLCGTKIYRSYVDPNSDINIY